MAAPDLFPGKTSLDPAIEAGERLRLYDALLASSPDFAYVFDLGHRFIYANPALLGMWGKSWDEAIGRTCLELGYEPWHAAMHDREIEKVIETRQPIRGEVPFYGAYGPRIYDYIFTPIFGADGQVEAVSGYTRDVTDRRLAEDRLRKNEEAMTLALQYSQVCGVFDLDLVNNIFTCDERVGELFNLSPAQAVTGIDLQTVMAAIHPEDLLRVRDHVEDAKRTREPYVEEHRLVDPDGRVRWITARGQVLSDDAGAPARFPGIVVDITDRKQLEEEVRRREHRNQIAMNASHAFGLWDWDIEANIVTADRRFAEMFGLDGDEANGGAAIEKFMEAIHPDDLPRVRDNIGYSLRTGHPFQETYRLIQPNGNVRWISVRGQPEFKGAEAVRFPGVGIDITIERTALESLQEKESFLESVLDSSPDCVEILSLDGTVASINRNGLALIEAGAPTDVIGRRWQDRWQGDFRDRMAETLAAAGQGETSRFEGYGETMKGSPRWWAIAMTPILSKDDIVTNILVVSRDITNRKRSDAIIDGQKKAFEQAIHGDKISNVLKTISEAIERQSSREIFCSIMLVDPGGKFLRVGAAPSLSQRYFDEIDGLIIGPGCGACGECAHSEQEYYVADFTTDPRYENFAALARAEGIKSAWSSPLFSADNRLVGTVCIYYPEVTEPSAADRDVVKMMSDTAALIISWNEEIAERARAEREVRESEKRFRDKIDTMAQMIWVTEADGFHEYYNRRWYDFTGVPEGSTDGEGWNEMFHPDDRERAWARWNHSLTTGVPYEIEYRLRRHDGIYCWVLGRAMPIHDSRGRILKWVGSCTLIEDQKRLQAELEQARIRSEEANLAKSEFLANMSHEIRTPMNAVVGISNILSATPAQSPRQQQLFETLQSSANALLALIDDLLDISKIEARSLELEAMPFRLDELFAEIVRIMSVKADERGLDFTCDLNAIETAGEVFRGDSTRIRQVVMNLCSNAIKFTDAGFVRIDVRTDALDDRPGHKRVTVRIADSGVGIDPGKIEAVFQKFTQADSSINRKYGGTGLGLAISKTLVESMGGTLTVESEPERGSVFTATFLLALAVDDPPEWRETPGDAPPPSAARQKILLVEDYAPNIMVAQIFLEQFGYDSEVANNGAEAVERYLAGGHALILMDVQMHGMNGFDATREIRRLEQERGSAPMPIIGMTAHAIAGDRERCLAAGMNDYVSKPYEPDDLRQKIARLIATTENSSPKKD